MRGKDLLNSHFNKAPEVEGEVYTVSEITAEIKSIITGSFGQPDLWIRGEVSNYKGKTAQGHIYFRLKDEKAVINMAFFSYANRRHKFEIEEGMDVYARGRLSVYEPQGSYQMIVEEIRPAGVGALYKKFEQLKRKLEENGLFDEDKKKRIPFIPQRIGIITSPTGAAIRDMLKIIANRLPSCDITIFPVRVQGTEAKKDIEKALKLANKRSYGIDLIILGRGGGSIEELWPFNEEMVAMAVFSSKVPVISAVGHESDFTISDFVADVRAATPSNAAEIALPDIREIQNRIDTTIEAIVESVRDRIELYSEKITGLKRSAALKDPMNILRTRQQMLDHLIERSASALRLTFQSFGSKLSALESSLKALNPTAILERGYSIASDAEGKVIKRASDVKIGQEISLRLSRGRLGLKVKRKKNR